MTDKLPAEVEIMLDAERELPDVTDAVRARLHDAVVTVGLPPTPADGSTVATHAASATVGKTVVVAVVSAMVGAGGGIGIYEAVRDDEPAAAPISETAPAPTPERVIEEEPAILAPAKPSPKQEREPEQQWHINRERLLIDTARTALQQGALNEALDAVHRHAREYPNGAMVEEREVIAIVAMARSGRATQAKLRAQRFFEQFPSSVHRTTVEAATSEER